MIELLIVLVAAIVLVAGAVAGFSAVWLTFTYFFGSPYEVHPDPKFRQHLRKLRGTK